MKSNTNHNVIITFNPLAESHFPLLLKWLETPHVKAWWDPTIARTPALIEEKYRTYVKGYKRLELKDRLIEKPLYAFVICLDKRPIGYIQYYSRHDFPPEQGDETIDLPPSCAGLDGYIGEPEFIGKGIGSKALSLFIEHTIFQKFDAVIVDPDTANTQAIRAYEKAGFRCIKKVNKGEITWMIRDRDSQDTPLGKVL